ncbi:aspartate-semialdehyde dehydrogenase [Deinococcus yavapaiensis]|uniref:Aspartate-semialdehyde dehydrogenase n=1 Tax=Deinococcus yavapaiensis KR-236 TaxID=694435 RepID=A0A318S8Z8_9DEIO|nr:aspartate-semialdehyde dehydrogenase [Deinococcus yavapaiensis]PYE53501.1 aspartate semialdehyde dehydrogenase [Deinococcus yavapaiensis KR-236]
MKIAIVGATGAVGVEMLRVLEASTLQPSEVQLYASARSAGSTLPFRRRDLVVRELVPGPIPADVILASAGGSISKAYAPDWVAGGSVVIDNSSAFRLDADVPLVIPEINPDAALSHRGIIANPNCTTAIAAVAVWPLHRAFGVRRMIISTYQATSGAGAKGMEELLEGTRAYLDEQAVEARTFAHAIPFNLIPHIDTFQDNGYTREEMKVAWETRKIFGEPNLRVSCTAVRIPTLRAHSEAITLEFERSATPDEARELLGTAPGVELVDDPAAKRYPMPLTASGKYDVEVGRVRASLVFDGGLDFFVSGDQLLKGAALNAVQIAELLHERGALRAVTSSEVVSGR